MPTYKVMQIEQLKFKLREKILCEEGTLSCLYLLNQAHHFL